MNCDGWQERDRDGQSHLALSVRRLQDGFAACDPKAPSVSVMLYASASGLPTPDTYPGYFWTPILPTEFCQYDILLPVPKRQVPSSHDLAPDSMPWILRRRWVFRRLHTTVIYTACQYQL